ncbi:DNA-directed RNA polymerase subunit A'' [Nanoarchaeota archaeon]|nr:MAG: DNA-directed RNA polymerase subunit A'' [Nanoarchaeota archaeon]
MKLEVPKSIREEVEEIAREKKLKKEKVEKLMKEVEERYYSCLISPSEAIGVITAQSVGEPSTQLTMRTKLTSGIGEITITLGLPRLIEILDAKKTPSTPSMTIYLKSHIRSSVEAKKVAKKILEVCIKDVAKEVAIDLLGKRIEVTLDRRKMKILNVNLGEIRRALEKLLKNYRISKDKDVIIIKPRKRRVGIRELYKVRNFVESLHIRGIHGIRQVLPMKVPKEETWVIKTAGSNLRDVLKLEEVDPKRTVTNDIFEIARVLGIEAAREAIVREISETLREQGVDVNIRHIMLIADMMTWSGRIKGITRYGVTGEKASVLARASFEVPLHHLIKASIHNEVDELKSVVENVIVNQVIPVGTGVPKLIYRSEVEEEE